MHTLSRMFLIAAVPALLVTAALGQRPVANPEPEAATAKSRSAAIVTRTAVLAAPSATPAPEPKTEAQARPSHRRAIWITSAVAGAAVVTIVLVRHFHKHPCYNPVIDPITGAGC